MTTAYLSGCPETEIFDVLRDVLFAKIADFVRGGSFGKHSVSP